MPFSSINMRTSWSLCFGLFAATFIISESPVKSQQYSVINTPPILHVLERNWKISSNEKVGQVIARINADDAENDKLTFGLELHQHSYYSLIDNTNKPARDKLPFFIHPETGVVYLNESLVGREGENFFLYVTVTDGQLTAKNEVFVNIGGHNEKSRISPVQNINQNLSNSLFPFGKVYNLPVYTPIDYTGSNMNFNNERPVITTNNFSTVDNEKKVSSISATIIKKNFASTKLSPLIPQINKNNNTSSVEQENSIQIDDSTIKSNNILRNENTFSTPIFVMVIGFCGMSFLGIVLFGFFFNKRLGVIKQYFKKNDESSKNIKQSNEINTANNESDHSMDMHQWTHSHSYSNRYTPWKRDELIVQNGTLNREQHRQNNQFEETCSFNGNRETKFNRKNSGSNDRWEFPRHRLKFFDVLGEGAFGQVWRCEAIDIEGKEGLTTVAVKTLKESASQTEKNDLLSELEVLKSLEPHVNVVRLLGCSTDKDPIFIILEFMNRGKLQAYLRDSRFERSYRNINDQETFITSAELICFMYQIAKGMDYLTSKGIIHRDLAARNILLSDDRTCKIADFGLARLIQSSKAYERKSEGKLPVRWMAIESLYDNLFTAKSDVWSFGILMWEIVTLGSTPYPGMSAREVMRKVRDGYRLQKPEHCRRELYNIMFYCWAKHPNERPSFSDIVSMIAKLLQTEKDYIELERFPDHNYYNILNISDEKL